MFRRTVRAASSTHTDSINMLDSSTSNVVLKTNIGDLIMAGTIDRKPNEGFRLLLVYTILVILGLVLGFTRACAQKTQVVHQYDTIMCNSQHISKYIEQPTANGKSTRVYAVYNDDEMGISDIIPVSKTVLQYIQMCQANNIRPSLGIKLRDGQIQSLIRVKRKWDVRRKKK